MRNSMAVITGLSCLTIGYVLGWSGAFSPEPSWAQEDPAAAAPAELSDETREKIQAARTALEDAMEALKTDGRYKSATKSMNCLAVLAGGFDARQDLEAGRGVDPETFAALYAGFADDDVETERDEKGRLTYKGRVIRMYPISRIKQLFTSAALAPAEEDAEGTDADDK